MPEVVISANNISKIYRLGQIGTGTISKDLERFWKMRVLGKEDPFFRISEENNRAAKGNSDFVYSLKDVNFEIEKGKAYGIIGRNGAGKSTLLKILSKVTAPSTGSIKVKGRIASLLEVGTGFHPDLSGKENIYLNGAILGMRKNEITRKLDEIINFSGVERYIDTPVKRYSSGMYVRLAFAVAAHLESEILVVDEVLAVGDAEFQAKCLGKMNEVSNTDGRTVLFVSHNMSAIKNLCSQSIYLDNGTVKYMGDTDKAVNLYFNVGEAANLNGEIPLNFERHNTGEAKITYLALVNSNQEITNQLFFDEPIAIDLNLDVMTTIPDALIDIKILNADGETISYSANAKSKYDVDVLNIGKQSFHIVMANNLQPGIYKLSVGVHFSKGNTIDYLEQICEFTVLKIGKNIDHQFDWIHGYIDLPSTWEKRIN
jgi:lipopolysaccharide transport system ATP-binding protein